MASLDGGPMYALGGLDDNTCYSTVERYDPETNTWSEVQEMNFPRGGVAVASMKVRYRDNRMHGSRPLILYPLCVV